MFKSKKHFGLAINHNVAILVTLTNDLIVDYHIFTVAGDDSNAKFCHLAPLLTEQIAALKLTNHAMHFAVPSICTLKKIIPFNVTLSTEDIELELTTNQKKYFPEVDGALKFEIIIKTGAKSCTVLPPTTEEENCQDVYVFALRESDLIEQLNLAKNIKVKIASLGIDSYALLRAIIFSITLSTNPLDVYFFIYEQQQQLQLIAFNQDEILHETYLCALPYRSAIDVLQQQWSTLQLHQPNYCLKQIYLPAISQQNILPIINPSLTNLVMTLDPWQPFSCEKISNHNEHYITTLTALGLALRGITHVNN